MEPSMNKFFDLVVIGTGTAASTVASRCRTAKWTVAVVDSRPFGGTCALRGCDPKKVLVGAAESIEWSRRLDGKGIPTDGAHIEWPQLMAFKRSMIAGVPSSREEGFVSRGIESFHGRAKFIRPNAVSVDGDVLESRHFVVAAGAKPVHLSMRGREHVVTSDQFLDLDQLPRRIVFIGGGYISFEFAHVAARAGAQVTIVHQGERPLKTFDPDLVDLLVRRTRGLGITVHLQTEVTRIEPTEGVFRVHGSSGGQTLSVEADMVVHGAGRVAEIDDLDLEVAGVEWTSKGVTVNDYLQSTSNPAVYAAGDAAATDSPKLTPVAAYHGRIVAANLLEGNSQKPDHSGVPSVVFTVPPLASVGLQERVAQKHGLRFTARHEDTASWYSSRRIGEGSSGFKVLVEEGSGRILGAHLLGPNAEEIVNLFAMAMHARIPAPSIRKILFAYPTSGSEIQYML
jgi:glutathione reductase (NADPH)